MIGWACCATSCWRGSSGRIGTTRRLMRDAVPLHADSLADRPRALARAVGLRAPVRWAVNFDLELARRRRPVAAGRDLPPDLEESLTPKQLTWVLLHELAHIRRGDLWVVVVQRVVQAVFFFNPAVHLANWIIDELREYACDDAALAACKTSRRDCGEGFLAIIERSVERAPVAAPALGLFESRMLIRRRLVRILDDHRTVHARLSLPAARAGSLVLGPVRAGIWPAARRRRRSAGQPPIHSETRSPCRTAKPASYRPGAVWHRETRLGKTCGRRRARASSGGRGVVLALAYSPDGIDPGFGRGRRGGPACGTWPRAGCWAGSKGTATPSPAWRSLPTAKRWPRGATTGP